MDDLIFAIQVPKPWVVQAACRGLDPEIFFPERGDTFGTRKAKAICAGCPVMLECREEHIEEREGIWGGLSTNQRRIMSAERARNRTCGICGVAFKFTGPTQKYCNKDCTLTARRERKREERLRSKTS